MSANDRHHARFFFAALAAAFLAAVVATPQSRGDSSPSSPILVLAAHPDDEVLPTAGIIEAAVDAGRPIYVAVVTNGARSGSPTSPLCDAADGTAAGSVALALQRDQESKAALDSLGVPWTSNVATSHLFFLGYPNGGLQTIAAGSAPDDPSGLNHTFAYDGSSGASTTCNGDYHYLKHGTHADLTLGNLQQDLDELLAQVQPGDVYTHIPFDGHTDHQTVAKQLIAALIRTHTSATVHEAIVHPAENTTCQPSSAYLWPNPAGDSTTDPAERATPMDDLEAPPVPACASTPKGYDWGPWGIWNEKVGTPADMRVTNLDDNRKWQAIALYASQLGCTTSAPYTSSCGYMYGFVKHDETFWTQDVSPTGPPVPINYPGLSGAGAGVGVQLTAKWATHGMSTWTDAYANGTTGSPDYQWLRCNPERRWECTEITGASAETYTPTADDGGYVIRVRVIAHNAAGEAPPVFSMSTDDPVLAAPTSTAPPQVTGTPADDSILQASHGDWTGLVTSYDYVWQVGPAATGPWTDLTNTQSDPSTYEVKQADVGKWIRVKVTASNTGGSNKAYSSAVGPVTASAPVNLTAPTISPSTAGVGTKLTGDVGSWNGSGISWVWTYAWLRCTGTGASTCTPIASETTKTYTVVAGDVLAGWIRFQVSATNVVTGANAPVTAVSGPLELTPIAPAKTADPTISGTATQGQSLTVASSFSGSRLTYTYQWQRSGDGSTNWAVIAGATAASYTLTSDDVGSYVRVVVTATNDSGSASGTSAPTDKVAAPPAPPVTPPVTPPVSPPPSGGGGGGGGGGGLAADMAVDGSVSATTAKTGDTLVWTVNAVDTNNGPAVDVFVDLQLSDNLTLVGTTVTRGPGCTVIAPAKLRCPLDWMSGDAPKASITVTTTVAADGDYTVTATVGELIPDPVAGNNTAVLKASTPPPPPPAPPATKPAIKIVKTTVAKSRAVTVTVAISGWTVNAKHAAGLDGAKGYWVIYVDSKRNTISRQAQKGVTKPLKPGRHVIRVELIRENGLPVVPRALSKTVTVVVPGSRR